MYPQYYNQYPNQTFPSGPMQNQNINMGTNIQSQSQDKGQIGQHTQSNTAQYDQSGKQSRANGPINAHLTIDLV